MEKKLNTQLWLGVVIAIAGYYHYLAGERTPLDVAPVSRLSEF